MSNHLEAIEARFERQTGAHRIYRYRGGHGNIDIQICVPLNCKETELDYRIFLVGESDDHDDT